MTDITLSYYGYLFDASGYGHAARGYLHALHAAGVDVTAVELGRRPRQVQDPLVESLVRRRANADLHLFHGIPPEWARVAFRLRNAIGMTVWETDAMPTQWQSILSHVRELWLPCAHNMEVFGADLLTPVFRLPHVLYEPAEDAAPPMAAAFPAATSDWVVYSIFEWQDRKNPRGMIEAFLRAFPREDDALLVLKTNPGAAATAEQALAEARTRTGSTARVALHAESWPRGAIRALRDRGDCYLSLHRGEGWGYPLFEAAARGTPVVATAHGGPLDYLRPEHHALVRWTPTPVHQPYLYYHPRMRWAEPDLEHAAELLRTTRADAAGAAQRAGKGAAAIAAAHRPAVVGAVARDRLLQIRDRLRQHRPRHATLAVVPDEQPARQSSRLTPPVPIPGEWYDADYFEHGVKSNWGRGYGWGQFAGLFRDTAAFLVELFPEARTFLDAGCAKGFLVRALRERGREAHGFDCSAWAIDHAEPLARPTIRRADVLEYEFERDYDVIVALDLLSHLTPTQAQGFLQRARERTTIALLATIPVAGPAAPGDRDHTHVTRQDRRWWTELLLDCGWRQDPLHRALETHLQRHALPARMGWPLYLFSPGERAAAGSVLRGATA